MRNPNQLQFDHNQNNLGNLALPLYEQVWDQLQFGSSLEPYRQNLIRQILASLSQGNQQALISSFGRQAQARARSQGQQTALQLASRGMPGLGDAAALDASNQAASATNDFASQVLSPQGQMQALQTLLAVIGGAQQSPLFGTLMQAQQGANQYQQILNGGRAGGSSGGGALGGVLGTLLGASQGAIGGWLGNVFGGGKAPAVGVDASSGVDGLPRVQKPKRTSGLRGGL